MSVAGAGRDGQRAAGLSTMPSHGRSAPHQLHNLGGVCSSILPPAPTRGLSPCFSRIWRPVSGDEEGKEVCGSWKLLREAKGCRNLPGHGNEKKGEGFFLAAVT